MTIIQITPDGYLVLSGDAPEQGRKYALEDATDGTPQQNRAFHPLVQEFFKSGCHSYNCASWQELKDFVKRDMGAGFEEFKYAHLVDGKLQKGSCKTKEEIPEGAVYWGELKSWAKYTKKQRRETMDLLISTMIQAGVNSKKFHEILDGMGRNSDS